MRATYPACLILPDSITLIIFLLKVVLMQSFTISRHFFLLFSYLFPYSMVQDIIWKADCHSDCQKYPAFFMEPECSSPCSQKPALGLLSPQYGASSGCGWREGLQIRKVAANILNKQSRTADKEWFSSLGVGRGAATLTFFNEVFQSASDTVFLPLPWKYSRNQSVMWTCRRYTLYLSRRCWRVRDLFLLRHEYSSKPSSGITTVVTDCGFTYPKRSCLPFPSSSSW
jgi:hypothetical protein